MIELQTGTHVTIQEITIFLTGKLGQLADIIETYQ